MALLRNADIYERRMRGRLLPAVPRLFRGMFDGYREDLERHLASMSSRYYVYLLCRPNGRPFYVGKGVGRRALEHEAEARRRHPFGESNPFKCNVIRKILGGGERVRYQIDSIYDFDDELACLDREANLISQHRRLHEGGCLTNFAGGIGNMSGPCASHPGTTRRDVIRRTGK